MTAVIAVRMSCIAILYGVRITDDIAMFSNEMAIKRPHRTVTEDRGDQPEHEEVTRHSSIILCLHLCENDPHK